MTRDLTPFFAPKSIAVVGAGERRTSSGGAVLQNLRIAGFTGTVIPVNPKGGEMFGHAVQRSLKELNEPADVAVIVIRPDLILDAVREAAESGGDAEYGEDGRGEDRDKLFREAAEVLINAQQGSTSLLQRRLKSGYGRAARIIDQLHAAGVLGPADGPRPRDVLVGFEELERICGE